MITPLLLLALAVSATAQSTYGVPASPPSSNTSPKLLAAPLGVSFEFFTLPGYMAVASTKNCLANLAALTGTMPPIRIGGTTQDRALYDPSLSQPVSYSVSSSLDAPGSLTYGPSYFSLLSAYTGRVTIGLNRRLDQLTNTMSAAFNSLNSIPTLYAIELGNEPEFYGSGSPVAQNEEGGNWSPSYDADSQTYWQSQVGQFVNNSTPFIQAGVRLQLNYGWSVAELLPVEQSSGSISYVKSFGGHNYPQSACGGAATYLDSLMLHSNIKSNLAAYVQDAAVAASAGKPYHLSETNSATCGGGGISSAFGAGLWVMDYVLQGLVGGIQSFNFHHGTIGNSPYDWWGYNFTSGQNITYATYYGAYFATAALAGAGNVAMLDGGNDAYATYIVYSTAGKPIRAVLYNSDYYGGTGTRSSRNFTLTDLPKAKGNVQARRLTAPAATSKVELGVMPTFGGVTFSNTDCLRVGKAAYELVPVKSSTATFTVAASEALLVIF